MKALDELKKKGRNELLMLEYLILKDDNEQAAAELAELEATKEFLNEAKEFIPQCSCGHPHESHYAVGCIDCWCELSLGELLLNHLKQQAALRGEG